MLTRVIKAKLMAFVVITAVTLLVTALNYVRLPQQVGIGRYDVSLELPSASGLYPQAMVTYRGVEVGKVTDVDLEPDGSVVARLQIDDGTELPASSVVEVRSASVIGEQYVNFVPNDGADGGHLVDGAVIPADRAVLPTTTTDLLTSIDDLLASVPLDDLETVVDELGAAMDGVGADLGRFIDANGAFLAAATDNLPATVRLIDDSRKVLRTQQELDPSIRSLASSLQSFTGQLEQSDGQLSGLLAAGAPFMEAAGGFALDLTGVAPGMLAELAQVGEVLKVYRDGIEHVLIVLPAVTTALTSAIPVDQRKDGKSVANQWFKLGVDPPTCTKGFEDAQSIRNPDDLSPADPPSSSWCKVAADDVRAARGARNHPCPNGGTGATAADCGLVFSKSGLASLTEDVGSDETSSPLPASLELGLSSFLLSGAPAGASDWRELLKGLVRS